MIKILRRMLAAFVLLVVAYNIIHNPTPTAAPEIAGSVIAVLIACALAWWLWPKGAK